jgi:serine/threonine-protein kinase
VFLAKDLRLKREVAVKVTRPDFALNSQMMQRFRREAEVVAALRHPHIMPIYDIGEADGIAYIVMPYIRGESLKARLDREGKLPVELARRILLQVGDALHEAHEAGVVHRDVKPDNVMLDRREDQVPAHGLRHRQGGRRRRGRALDLADQHRAGHGDAALHEPRAGRGGALGRRALRPVRARRGGVPHDRRRAAVRRASVRAILAKQLVGARDAAAHRAPDVPPALAMAIERAMAKDPDDRYPSVESFLDAVRSDPHYAAEVLRTTGGVPAVHAARRGAGGGGHAAGARASGWRRRCWSWAPWARRSGRRRQPERDGGAR